MRNWYSDAYILCVVDQVQLSLGRKSWSQKHITVLIRSIKLYDSKTAAEIEFWMALKAVAGRLDRVIALFSDDPLVMLFLVW